jgi:hypothetical protein
MASDNDVLVYAVMLAHVTKHPKAYVLRFLRCHDAQGTLGAFLDALGSFAHKSVFRQDSTRPRLCCLRSNFVCGCSPSVVNGLGPLPVPSTR